MTETCRTPCDQLANADLQKHLKKVLFGADENEAIIRTDVGPEEAHALIDIGGRTIWVHSGVEPPHFKLVGEGWCLIADWADMFTAVRAQTIVGDEEGCMNDLVIMRMLL